MHQKSSLYILGTCGRKVQDPSFLRPHKEASNPSIHQIHSHIHTHNTQHRSHNIVHTTSFTQHRSPTSHGRLTRAAHTLPLCCFSSGLIDDALPTYRPTYLPVVCACSCHKNTPLSTVEYIHTGLETGDTSPRLCRWCSLQPCILHHHTSTTCPMIHADRGGTHSS